MNWVAGALQDAELTFGAHYELFDVKPKHRPSHYWHNNCYATFQSDAIGLKLLDYIGADRIMWAQDYPHSEGTFGYTALAVKEILDAVSEADARRILGENASSLYGLDDAVGALAVDRTALRRAHRHRDGSRGQAEPRPGARAPAGRARCQGRGQRHRPRSGDAWLFRRRVGRVRRRGDPRARRQGHRGQPLGGERGGCRGDRRDGARRIRRRRHPRQQRGHLASPRRSTR